jgi:competence protein ComEC
VTRYPGLVIALAWSAAIAATVVLVPMQPLLGVFTVAAAVPALALALVLRPALIAFALAAALLAVGRAELPPTDAQASVRAASLVGSTVVMSGRIADDARAVGGGAEALVEPSQIIARGVAVRDIGNLLLRWRGPELAGFDDRVKAAGRLVLPRDLPTFDRRAYLAQRSVFLELDATSFDVVGDHHGLTSLPAFLRQRFTAALDEALPAPHAAVLLGIVLGIRQGIPPELDNALIATGLIHLLVLSGLKVAVFARIVQGALAPVLGRLATWPALGLVALYALAGGATPAAVRASAMGGIAIAATHLGRPSHVWTSLAVTAAAMLGWHPELAWDVGFQLSFAGTAAIILLTPGIARRVRFLPHVLREPFAVTCAAQIGTAPMMATDFHVLSPVAPVANALTLPILPALIAAGLALGLIDFVPTLARLAALPVAGLIAYVEHVAYVLAHVPSAAIAIPAFPTWIGLAYYSGLAPAIGAAHARGRSRKLGVAAAAVAPLIISASALAAWASAPSEAVVMSVADGQAVLLRGPHGTVLVDGGPSPTRLADELGTQLPPWQRGLDALIITAPGLGHVGGLAAFDRTASLVVVPAGDVTGSAWRSVALEQLTRGARVTAVTAGAAVQLAGFEFEFIAPEPGAPGDEPGAADLAFRAVAPDGRSFCDFSDLDLDGQTIAAARMRGPCSDVLLPSGGRSRLSPELERAAVSTQTTLVASRGAGRLATGYPPDVLRTDQEGTITLPL